MSDGVLIALIGAVAAVLSTVLTSALAILLWFLNRKVNRTKEAAERSADQLENGHVDDPGKTSNIRDEITENHEETKRMFRQVRYQLSAMATVLTNTIARVDEHDADFLELTGPPPGKGKHRP